MSLITIIVITNINTMTIRKSGGKQRLLLLLLVISRSSSYPISFLHPPPTPLNITISFQSPDDGSVNVQTLIVAPSSARITSSEAREIARRIRSFCTSYSSTQALEICVGSMLDRVYRKFPQVAERKEYEFSGGRDPRGQDLKQYCVESQNEDPLRCEQNMLNELGYDIPVKPLDSHKVILFWKRVYLVGSFSLPPCSSELKHNTQTGIVHWKSIMARK